MTSPQTEDSGPTTATLICDVVFGLTLVALGIFLLVWILLTPSGFGQASSAITFRTIPIICSSALVVLAAIHSVGRVMALVTAIKAGKCVRLRIGAPSVVFWQRAATIGALVAYVVALGTVPFIIATFALLVLMFWGYGERSPLRIALVASLGSAGLSGLFIHVLKLPI